VDIDERDVFGRTALMYAVHYGHVACADTLLARGADPDAIERNSGATALHEAVYHGTSLMA
jgi:ankyrin repeat protein